MNLTIQADSITMSEKPLTELSCWDMPLANSNKTENWIKRLKWKACLLSSKYEDSPLKLLNYGSRIDLSVI